MAAPNLSGVPTSQLTKASSLDNTSSDAVSHTLSAEQEHRPLPIKHVSESVYQSPMRHHQKTPTNPKRHIKETLNAKSEYSNSEDDGPAEHRINQYLIKQEIGRGSFGSVHLAVDQFGREYAVKEFSKSRLRKRAQSNMLRKQNHHRAPGHISAGRGFNMPLHRRSMSPSPGEINSLEFIREEIAIMKKLYHPNLVALIEVLDDPTEDSLYMVLEMCKKGVVMKVGLDDRCDAYDDERCRFWFRDMILGIEYLHAQGIIHRDIKPDNCLVTEDDVLKIVDFGVSEMFSKDSEMTTAKSAGSPAFMPPELCVAHHGEVSGRAADIWSMGVTLFCLRFGHIPFEKTVIMDLWESIKNDAISFDNECDADMKNLLLALLEKDPQKRITMDELREHPWVTRRGTDKLLSKEENVSNLVEPPTEEELKSAITSPIRNLFVVMRAVKQFKKILIRKRPELMESILGGRSRMVQPPLQIHKPFARTRSDSRDDRTAIEGAFTSKGVIREVDVPRKWNPSSLSEERIDPRDLMHAASPPAKESYSTESAGTKGSSGLTANNDSKPTLPRRETGKGQAHDPLLDTLFLNIGPSSNDPPGAPGSPPLISESPGAVEINVYEKAYTDEVKRILEEKAHRPTLYLNRRVEGNKELRDNEHITDHSRSSGGMTKLGFGKLVSMAKSHAQNQRIAPESGGDECEMETE